MAVATWLEKDPRVEYVTYAGLPSSPWHERAERLYPNGAGALFTFALKGGYEACVKLVNSVKLFSHVANLGDARSLIIHSASTTHRQLTPEQLEAAGASPNDGAALDRHRGSEGPHRRPRPGAGRGRRLSAHSMTRRRPPERSLDRVDHLDVGGERHGARRDRRRRRHVGAGEHRHRTAPAAALAAATAPCPASRPAALAKSSALAPRVRHRLLPRAGRAPACGSATSKPTP